MLLTRKAWDCGYNSGVKGQGQTHLNLNLSVWLVTRISLTLFDRGGRVLFWAHRLPNVCR